MQSILIIVDYFGTWPEWFPLFLESCRWNPTVNWLINTDCQCSFERISNVEFRHVTKQDYVDYVRKTLGVRFAAEYNYKLCEIRPMYGVLYEKEIADYDFFGYGDIDVVYGDIRSFYTDEVLKNNVISTHRWCVSGHLALIRNTWWLRTAFTRIEGWQELISDKLYYRFDEDIFRRAFQYPYGLPDHEHALYDEQFDPAGAQYRRGLYWVEQYTTPLTPSRWIDGTVEHPEIWYWKEGRVTNAKDGEREFIYLHFMNYKNARFMRSGYATSALWSELDTLVHVAPDEFHQGVEINRNGFFPIRSVGDASVSHPEQIPDAKVL